MTLSISRTDREFAKFCETVSGETAVRVCADDPINVYISQAGSSENQYGSNTSTPGLPQTLISYVVPLGKKLKLVRAQLVSNFECHAQIKKNGSVIGSVRTSPASKVEHFDWITDEIASAGSTVEMITTQRQGSPADLVENFLSGILSDA